jgi:RHS repeat-associated protein
VSPCEKTSHRVRDFAGRETKTCYFMRIDAAYYGKIRLVENAREKQDLVSFRYDRKSGKPTTVKDRLGNSRNLEYDANGNCVKLLRRAAWSFGKEPVRSFAYDRQNRLAAVSELDEEGNTVRTTTLGYDRSGRPARIADGCRTLDVSYSASGFPVEARDDFALVAFAYDRYNRLVSTTDANGITTVRTYADHGGVAKIERRDGKDVLSSVAISYDGSGRPVSTTDQNGFVKSCERDADGRIAKETFPDGSEVAYSYDALGRLAQIVDENGHEIEFGWDAFGLATRITAAGQLTKTTRDSRGRAAETSASKDVKADRTIRREYDEYGRLAKISYAKDEIETLAYDAWGRLASHTRGKSKESYRYDHFGRLVEKDENGTVFTYGYDAWWRRTSRTIRFANDGEAIEEVRAYDRFGRLVEIASFGASVKYHYDAQGRVSRQIVDGTPIDFTYTKQGLLAGKYFGGRQNPVASLEYEYAKDGRIVARTANGVRQTYEYDRRGQLLAVKENGADVERYTYDKAGNMVRKTVRGKTMTFAFDGANQLVSSTTDGVATRYEYDAVGRLVCEGNKTYRYGYLDKVLSVADGAATFSYDYHVDGQLASADYGGGKAEQFTWDGLALVQRGDATLINEPHVGGGNPVVSSLGVTYFNDVLGTTVGARRQSRYAANSMTAFGEGGSRHAFFTGKPQIDGLGHAFLFRNYRASLAKWQTADPFGYPDGWNQLAYCGNVVMKCIDDEGCKVYAVFSISRRKLVVFDLTTGVRLSTSAFSGDGNVENQWVPSRGPIPLGEYAIINANQDAHPNWFELWRNDGTWDDETYSPQGVRRGEFRLHEGTRSAGCITMQICDASKKIVSTIQNTETDLLRESGTVFFKTQYGTLKVIE